MGTERKRLRAIAATLAVFGLAASVSCKPAAPAGAGPSSAAANPSPGAFVSLAPDVHEPCGMTAAAGTIWVLGCSGSIVRVPASGGASTVSKLAGESVGLDALGSGGGVVWLLSAEGEAAARAGSVLRLDAGTGERVGAIELGASIPIAAGVAGERLWIATADGGVYFADDTTPSRADKGAPQSWVVADAERLFTVGENGDVIERSRTDGAVKATHHAVLPGSIAAAFGLGSIWLANEGSVVRVDPSSGRAKRVAVGGTVNDIEPCGGAVWLSEPDAGVRAVDARGTTVRDLPVVKGSRYLTCDGSKLWILTEDGRLGSIEATSR
jgi:hypothetical protein